MNESDVRRIEWDVEALQKQIDGRDGIDQRLEALEELKIEERIASLEAANARLTELLGRVVGVIEQSGLFARHADEAERTEPVSHDAEEP